MGSVSADMTLFGDLRELLIQTRKRIGEIPDMHIPAKSCVVRNVNT